MAKAIEDAINALELTDPVLPPATGDNSNFMLWIALFVGGAALTAVTVLGKKKKIFMK